jgi:hypothetical protein
MPLELSDAQLLTERDGDREGEREGGRQFTVTVTGEKSSKSSHDWVQIVGVAVYTDNA